ncbi:hypothetical protein IG631_10392 [Alternaria alternata]|nr:hypothetical protein IG631_10392 [Alternaria alternata]
MIICNAKVEEDRWYIVSARTEKIGSGVMLHSAAPQAKMRTSNMEMFQLVNSPFYEVSRRPD